MKRKIIMIVCLVAVGIIQFGCSHGNDSITDNSLSFDTTKYIVRDSLIFLPVYKFNLLLDKENYNIGDMIKMSFTIDDPPVMDASFTFKIIFPNQEKLGIEIYKASSLIYKYPSQITINNPDTLILPAILYHDWNQIDNDSNKVGVGEYTVKAYLLHDNYSNFVQQKKFLIIK